MSSLFFIRHGQASFGKGNYDALSETGWHQAERLAAYLTGHNIDFDAVYMGPQVRHEETARPLLALRAGRGGDQRQVTVMPELAEYDFGAVLATLVPILAAEDDNMNRDAARLFSDGRAFKRVFEAAALRWVAGDYPRSDFESWPDFKARVERGINKIMEQDGQGRRVIVFTSGGPLAVTAQKALGLSDRMTMRLNWQIVNCSLTRFKCTRRQLMLASFNEYSWLLDAGKTDLVTYK